MSVTEQDWSTLEAERHNVGVVTRRIHPASPHDLFLAVQQPSGRRMLVLRLPAAVAEAHVRRGDPLPATRGIGMEFAAGGGGRIDLRITLTTSDQRQVFNPLVTDVAGAAADASGAGEALAAAVDRFHQWRSLLQAIADTGLGAEARRGLYGELVILRDQIATNLPSGAAVAGWTGPGRTDQDFQLPTAAVEVKTGLGRRPQTLLISNERQLDDTGTPILLIAHVCIDERRGGSGESLNAAVDATQARLGTGAAGRFTDQLTRYGYLAEQRHLYDEPRYTVREIRFWQVRDDFPRIIGSDLRPGVGDCSYRISTTGLDPYLLSDGDVERILKGHP
ncbi:PD-(D/E)XK motif protein [Polymorphospora sp. NPDC050346]|uniref:PD-(D/E)XK motif protein n=1 Tax=Polymorphospora sp. NPDC050346 TaxID=3155780 RepID=UPI0033C14B0E